VNSKAGIGRRAVPNSKRPRARPPNNLRDKLGVLHGTLPKYSGPYGVSALYPKQ